MSDCSNRTNWTVGCNWNDRSIDDRNARSNWKYRSNRTNYDRKHRIHCSNRKYRSNWIPIPERRTAGSNWVKGRHRADWQLHWRNRMDWKYGSDWR
jgi:hypothetical protein